MKNTSLLLLFVVAFAFNSCQEQAGTGGNSSEPKPTGEPKAVVEEKKGWVLADSSYRKIDQLRYVINNFQRQDNQDLPLFRKLSSELEAQVEIVRNDPGLEMEQRKFLAPYLDDMKMLALKMRQGDLDACRQAYATLVSHLAEISAKFAI